MVLEFDLMGVIWREKLRFGHKKHTNNPMNTLVFLSLNFFPMEKHKKLLQMLL